MTVVVGYRDGSSWGIGADSGAFEDNGLYQLAHAPKCWASGDSLVGVAGSFRVMELVKKSGLGDPYSIRSHLLEANPGGEWGVLVVTQKAIYELADDNSVLKIKGDYCAIGAGNGVALGALALASLERFDTDRAVTLALKATGLHSTYAVPPYTKLVKKREKDVKAKVPLPEMQE